MFRTCSLLVGLLLLALNVTAQQYQGANYTQSMPAVGGSEITFWNIQSNSNGNASLLNYASLGSNGKRQDPTKIKRAVIVIHGLGQDPQTYMANALSALSQANANNPAASVDSIAIVAPLFANGNQKNVAYPWTDGLPAGAGSTSQALVWKGADWASGLYNVYPNVTNTISSYQVLDQMTTYFANKKLYPNLNQIVIAGHSLGGQTVQRYAAIGKNLGLSTPIRLWVANPNDNVWFNTSRPVNRNPGAVCPTYDAWRAGFASGTPNYNTALLNKGRAAILANYNSRSKIYAHGTLDFGDDSSSCAPFTVGANRDERFFELIKNFPPQSIDNVDFAPIGHDNGAMMASTMGQTRLFLDNLNGDGSRHLDFGDRLQAGDSPNPDPANAAPPAIVGTGAAGMTYQGCFADNSDDSTGHALPVSVSTSANTIEACTAACSSAGYSISGLLGSQCMCGNTLSYQAMKVVDRGCNTACNDNAQEMCGGYQRMSIWSNGAPSQRPASSTLNSTGTFTSIGCYVDNVSNRTLAAFSTASDSMTVESCAASCAGYQYMGLEYSRECYCSNTLGGAPTNATDCSFICSGNSAELCGAASRLSVYNNSAPITTTTTTTTTSAAAAASSTAAAAALATNAGYQGCFVDNGSSGRLLPHQAYSSGNNTIDQCTAACSALNLPIAGLEWGQECWCGSQLAYAATSAPADCIMPCAGNSSQACGNGNRLSIYSSLTNMTLPVAVAPQALNATSDGAYSLSGCYTDSTSQRVLSVGKPGGSVEACQSSCAAYPVFGVEYGGECYCDQALGSTAVQRDVSECSMACSGNSTELCGAGNRILVYTQTGAANASATSTATASSSSASTTSTTSTTSAATSATTTTAAPSVSTSTTSTNTSSTSASTSAAASSTPSIPSGYTDMGCYNDNTGSRALSSASYSQSNNTPAQCAAYCSAKGFRFSGTEYSSECYCGNSLASTSPASSGCSMTCSGDSSQTCGGPNRLNVLQDSNWKPSFFTVSRYDRWNLTDCVVDSVSARLLNVTINPSGGASAMTVESCLDACAAANMTWCGMEYASECYGAVAQPAYTVATGGSAADPTTRGCSMPCKGNSTTACGGSSRLDLYEYLTYLPQVTTQLLDVGAQ